MAGFVIALVVLLWSLETQAEVPVPPLSARGHDGVVILVCNEDPTRAPVYLAALPWDDQVVRWAIQRAEYVRELDYQTLLREPGERYHLLKGLVEAKYRLELARIALMAHQTDEVMAHWKEARQAAERVAWKGVRRLLGKEATLELASALARYEKGDPCGLVAARDRIEAAYGELSTLIEAGK